MSMNNNNNNNNDQSPHPEDASGSYTIFPTSPSSSSQLPSFGSPSPSLPVGLINFVGQGRHDKPAKFCVVDKNYPIEKFANMLRGFISTKPDVLISITGSAIDFGMPLSKQEQVFDRGLLKAAHYMNAWIITGGFDSGVVKRVGQAIRGQVALVPCIGIVPLSKVTHNALLLNPNSTDIVQYACNVPNSEDSVALNPDHTHFILVKSPIDAWGQEMGFRAHLEEYISQISRIPLVLITINGGPRTLEDIYQGIICGNLVIIVDGSGRASDAIAAYIKHHRDPSRFGIESWNQLKNEIWKNMTPEEEAFQNQYLELICESHSVILFNSNESEVEDMDKVILQSVLSLECFDFELKLRLGVKWGRADLLEELFQQYDTSAPADKKAEALAIALKKSLQLNKPDIYKLLVRKGASLARVNIRGLYRKTRHQIQRLSTFAGCKNAGPLDNHKGSISALYLETTPLLSKPPTRCVSTDTNNSAGSENSAVDEDIRWENLKDILREIDPHYVNLLQDDEVTHEGILLWALMTDRFELAKVVWYQTVHSVHTALAACRLYSTLQRWFRDEIYKQQCVWFEKAAIQVLSEMNYKNAVKVLEWQWEELSCNAIELAERAECKDFVSTVHVQRYFDEKFHSNSEKQVQVTLRTPIMKILLMVLTFTLYNPNAYVHINSSLRPRKISYFYSIPVVKLLTSTISYMLFLGILVVNVVMINPQDPHVSRFDVQWYEWLLWIWFSSELVEELNQFFNDRRNHFNRISNRMDAFMYGLLLIYFVLRLLAWCLKMQELLIAYTDILVLSTIACFLRFMNIFAFSKSLGPLFFVIIRLFSDVCQWSFIFVLFMISFQVGIYAFTLQAGESGWNFFPSGSMGVSFTAILGDLGEHTLELMSRTRFGVAVVLVYSLVTQVMLVNLLIAMMGNTYTIVKDNSDKEWKFYRNRLLSDYRCISSVPPPFNIINMIYRARKNSKRTKETEQEKTKQKLREDANMDLGSDVETKKATEKVLQYHEDEVRYALPSVSAAIYDRTRLLTAQRDSDREYLEKKIQGLEERLAKIQGMDARLDYLDRNIQAILSILQKD